VGADPCVLHSRTGVVPLDNLVCFHIAQDAAVGVRDGIEEQVSSDEGDPDPCQASGVSLSALRLGGPFRLLIPPRFILSLPLPFVIPSSLPVLLFKSLKPPLFGEPQSLTESALSG
jgi:hypothetical protein